MARLGPGVRRIALVAAAHLVCGCGSLSGCGPSGTVTRRGSRGDCPARSSTAHLAVLVGRRGMGEHHGEGDHRGQSPQAVGNDRGRRPPRETARVRSLQHRPGRLHRNEGLREGWPERVWAIEGSNGAGRPLAQRLLEAGEHVVDVPAKLAARGPALRHRPQPQPMPRDAHSIAVVAVRTKTLRVLAADGELEALRMLCDRRGGA